MNCFCESGKTIELKIEGDVGADPFWCNKCSCNFNIEDIPISDELAKEMSSWIMKYGEWIDWEEDRLFPNGIEKEDAFNQGGVVLMEKVKREIGNTYVITYSPTMSTCFY